VRWLAGCSPRGCEAGEDSAAALPQCTHGPDPLGSGWLCGRHFFLGPLPSSLSPLLQVHRVFLRFICAAAVSLSTFPFEVHQREGRSPLSSMWLLNQQLVTVWVFG
jgi:hypothetical protein